MAKPNDIEHVDNFVDIIWTEVRTRFGEFATPKDVIFHLVERGICEPTRVRNYLILIDFDRLLVENKGHITHTFMDLSIEYNLSDRQIQGIVYKYRNKFHKQNNIKRTKKREKIKISKKFVK
jgi:hypothetical protein